MKQQLVLASSSPRRRELLALLQIPYEVLPAETDETVDLSLAPSDIVEILSLRKAQAVYDRLEKEERSCIIIGADTIVVLDGQVLGKPADEAYAYNMLQALQGKTHQVFSGVACIDTATGRRSVSHRMTKVTMKGLTPRQIQRYIRTGEPLDKAGAYGIQGYGAILVERIEGDFYNVVGLSVSLLSDMLEDFGLRQEDV